MCVCVKKMGVAYPLSVPDLYIETEGAVYQTHKHLVKFVGMLKCRRLCQKEDADKETERERQSTTHLCRANGDCGKNENLHSKFSV